MLVISAGRSVTAQHESIFIDRIIDKTLDHRLPAGNERVVNPQSLTGLEQCVAAPLKQSQIEVAVRKDARLR